MEQAKQKEQKIQVTKETPRILIATYGTLRVGQSNYKYLLKDKSEFLGTYRTEPIFTLTGRRAGFPVLYTDGDNSVEYDLFAITDNKVLNSVHSLEASTGIVGDDEGWYKLMRLQNEEHGECFIYVQHGWNGDKSREILTGNWKDKDI